MEKDIFSFENVAKEVGKINKVLYGIDPYERMQDKKDLERATDLEDLERDNYLKR